MSIPEIDPLDRPVHGGKAIAEVLNLRDKRGEPSRTKAYYALEQGYVDADKLGPNRWTSTARRLLNIPQVTK